MDCGGGDGAGLAGSGGACAAGEGVEAPGFVGLGLAGGGGVQGIADGFWEGDVGIRLL